MSRTERLIGWGRVRALLISSDAVAVSIALYGAYLGRYQLNVLKVVPVIRPLVFPLSMAVWLLACAAAGLYRKDRVGSGYEEYRQVVTAAVYATVTVVMIAFLSSTLSISRGFLAMLAILGVALISGGRFLVRRVIQSWARSGRVLRRVLIVGANRQGLEIARQLAADASASTSVCGFLDEYRPEGSELQGIAVLGDPLRLHEVARRAGATHAVVIESALSWESLRYVISSMHRRDGLVTLLAPGMYGVNAAPLQLTQVGGTLLVASHASRIVGVEAVVKRSLDLALAVPLIVLTLPVQAVIALTALARGRAAVQWRTVQRAGGSPFRMAYLPGARAGAIHLARLPSLWNVASGEMSLVGPKPVTDADRDRYAAWADALAALKPGFFGPWWLSGRANPANLKEEIEADLRYARSYTFWMDVRILLLVAANLVRRRRPPAPPSEPVARREAPV